MKALVTCVCDACGNRVQWSIPQGMGADRFLAPIPCVACGARKLRPDVPEPPATQPELPGVKP